MVEHTVSRRYSWMLATVVALGTVVACGDDDGGGGDDQTSGSSGMSQGGGKGGTSPKGGSGGMAKGGSGGSSTGGAGPTAGTGGSPATGGSTPMGGDGGTVNGGSAGDPVTAGGGQGGDGDTGGTAGVGGTGGDGGEPPIAGTGGDGGAGGTGPEPIIDFTFDVDPGPLPLAPGGVNLAKATFVNNSSVPIAVTLSASDTDGVDFDEQTVNVPLGTDPFDAQIIIRGSDVDTGTADVTLTASVTGAEPQEKNVGLVFSNNMAKNFAALDQLAPFPHAYASSFQPGQEPYRAFDGVTDTWWVSIGTEAGQGPSTTNPEWIAVDFGAPVEVGWVKITPRGQRGPVDYELQVLESDGTTWDAVETVTDAPDTALEHEIDPPRLTEQVRVYVTRSRDPGGPTCDDPCDPRNVQIDYIEVRAEAPE